MARFTLLLSLHSILRFIVDADDDFNRGSLFEERMGGLDNRGERDIRVVINPFSKLIVAIDSKDRTRGSRSLRCKLGEIRNCVASKEPLRRNGILDSFYLKVANLVSFRLLVRRGAVRW